MKKLFALIVLSIGSLQAATLDTIVVSASGTCIGGCSIDASINRFLQVTDRATVESFTITLTDFNQLGYVPGVALQMFGSLTPPVSPYVGDVAFFGTGGTTYWPNQGPLFIGTSITLAPPLLATHGGNMYDILFGLIEGSGTTFPEAIRMQIFNSGATLPISGEFTISANGVVPIPAAFWLFGSALLGLSWVRSVRT